MKKFVSMIITMIIVIYSFSLISCGEKEPPIETVMTYGKFYTVQEAFDDKLLSLKDFDYIKDNEKTPENYTALDAETEDKIYDDYCATHAVVGEDMKIINYGSYNGCRAVFVQDKYYDFFFDTLEYMPWNFYRVVYEQKYIAGYPRFFWRLRIWKEYDEPTEIEKPAMPHGVFYSIKRAYSLGFLNDDELMKAIYTWPRDIVVDEETENDIIQDYKALDMETDFYKICYQGVYENCIVMRIEDINFYDAYQQEYYFKLFNKGFNDVLPVRCVWVPIEKILKRS